MSCFWSYSKKNEIIPYDKKRKQYLIGGWLSGICPSCEENTSGFYCENCGEHHQPESIYPHEFKYTQCKDVIYKKVNSLFLQVTKDEVLNSINSEKYPGEIIDFVLSKISYGPDSYLTRLSLPTGYGPKINFPGTNFNLAFSYTVGLAAFYLLCSDIYSLKYNYQNPFTTGNVRIVTAYGFDNVSAYLMGMNPILKKFGYKKTVDVNIINQFLLLNGRKFSTSKNHALWVRHLIENDIVHPDLLRLILARRCPCNDIVDFNLDGIVEELNAFIKDWNDLIYRIGCGERKVNINNFKKEVGYFLIICDKNKNISVELSVFFIDLVKENKKIPDDKILSYFFVVMFISFPLMPSTARKFFNGTLCQEGIITLEKLYSVCCMPEYEGDVEEFKKMLFNKVEKSILIDSIGKQ